MKKQKGFSIGIEIIAVLAVIAGGYFLVNDYLNTKKELGKKEEEISQLTQHVKDQNENLAKKDAVISALNTYVGKLSDIQRANQKEKADLEKKLKDATGKLPKAKPDDEKCQQSDLERDDAALRESVVIRLFCIYQPESCDENGLQSSPQPEKDLILKHDESIKTDIPEAPQVESSLSTDPKSLYKEDEK